jgi:predicted kinase
LLLGILSFVKVLIMKNKSKNPVVYLICGQIGAGKTTFAKKIENETGAIRFTPDEWMLKLYPEMPPKEEFDDYFYRCCDVVWGVASEIVKRGGDVILDFGFWKYKDRETYRELASEIGGESKLYYIDCIRDGIIERLHARNKERPNGAVEITDEMFDFYSPGFEPPCAGEKYILIGNNS